MDAAADGCDVVLELLLDNVDYINDAISMENRYGYTALHGAAIFGNKHCCDMLVQRGADESCGDKFGKTPVQLW